MPTVNGLPILKSPDRGLTIKEILRICVDEKVPKEKICIQLPMMVYRSAVFVIDLSSVNHIDLAADDCGVYGGHSSPSVMVEVDVDDDGNLGSTVRTMYKDELQATSISRNIRRFSVRRQYSWHSISKDYRRIITKVEENNKLLRFAIAQYIVKTNDTSKLFEKPHGQTDGDVRCVSSPSDIPRDRNQVYHHVRNVPGRIRSRSTGPAAAPNFTKLLSLQYSMCNQA